jgi:hypothetical protein
MLTRSISFLLAGGCLLSCAKQEAKVADATQESAPKTEKVLFMDVHDIGPGKVTFEAVADAHKKDLAAQQEFGVNFIKYWVDEDAGKVYCLAEAPSEAALFKTHQKAHGLVPDYIMTVSDGPEVALTGKQLFLDIHHLEPGAVSPADVAAAHEKDLAVQGKHRVNFINYWIDQKMGTVMCLSEAPDSLAVIATHTEAHGLVPSSVKRVKQGS